MTFTVVILRNEHRKCKCYSKIKWDCINNITPTWASSLKMNYSEFLLLYIVYLKLDSFLVGIFFKREKGEAEESQPPNAKQLRISIR